MAKLKEIKIPKYLRLEKGTMWFDDISGVRLYRNEDMFVGRGIKEGSKVPVDSNNNSTSEQDTYGYVSRDSKEIKNTSYFCTNDIDATKMERILTAMTHGILVPYNPKDPLPTIVKDVEQEKDFSYDSDGDVVFVGKNVPMFERLQKLNYVELKDFITSCDKSASDNLMDMYEYEIKGHNNLNRPRAEVIKLLRTQLSSFGPRMSALRVDELDDTDNKNK